MASRTDVEASEKPARNAPTSLVRPISLASAARSVPQAIAKSIKSSGVLAMLRVSRGSTAFMKIAKPTPAAAIFTRSIAHAGIAPPSSSSAP